MPDDKDMLIDELEMRVRALELAMMDLDAAAQHDDPDQVQPVASSELALDFRMSFRFIQNAATTGIITPGYIWLATETASTAVLSSTITDWPADNTLTVAYQYYYIKIELGSDTPTLSWVGSDSLLSGDADTEYWLILDFTVAGGLTDSEIDTDWIQRWTGDIHITRTA